MSDYYNRIHDEKVRAAHALLDVKRSDVDRYYTPEEREIIRAALPPLPEPPRPRLSPVEHLAWGFASQPVPGEGALPYAQRIVRARDAEIIAWLEWEDNVRGKLPHESIANRLLRELREADAP